jgi:hypothetical protein
MNYQVPYHLIAVMYLFRDDCLTGRALHRIWKTLGAFPADPIGVTVKLEGGTRVSLDTTIASPTLVSIMPENENAIAFFASSCFRKDARNAVYDSDLNLSFKRSGPWQGFPAPGSISLSISADFIEQLSLDQLIVILHTFVKVTAEHSAFYGLIDLATPQDGIAGCV